MEPMRGIAFALGLTCANAGCALALDGPDVHRPRGQQPACDTGKGLVVLDGVVGSLAGISGLATAVDGASATASGVLLVTAAIYLASAIHGNGEVNACRDDFVRYASDEVMPSRPTPAVVEVAPKPAVVTPPPAPKPVDEPKPVAKPVATKPAAPKPAKPAPAPEETKWADFWHVVTP